MYHIRILSGAQRIALQSRFSEWSNEKILQHFDAVTICTLPVGAPILGYVRDNEQGRKQVYDDGDGVETDFQGGGIYLIARGSDPSAVDAPESEIGFVLGANGYATVPAAFAEHITQVTYETGEVDSEGLPIRATVSKAEADAQSIGQEARVRMNSKPVLLAGMQT